MFPKPIPTQCSLSKKNTTSLWPIEKNTFSHYKISVEILLLQDIANSAKKPSISHLIEHSEKLDENSLIPKNLNLTFLRRSPFKPQCTPLQKTKGLLSILLFLNLHAKTRPRLLPFPCSRKIYGRIDSFKWSQHDCYGLSNQNLRKIIFSPQRISPQKSTFFTQLTSWPKEYLRLPDWNQRIQRYLFYYQRTYRNFSPLS